MNELDKAVNWQVYDVDIARAELASMRRVIDGVYKILKRAGWTGGRIDKGCTCMKCTLLGMIDEYEKGLK